MSELQTNPRFKDLLPPLNKEEADHLAESLKSEGCREPIRLWNNCIVDGYNRYALCELHGIPYKSESVFFANEDEVCEWIIQNQIGRRNLEPNFRTLLIGQYYELQKKRVGNPKAFETPVKPNYATVAQLENGGPTVEHVAEKFNVSPRTVNNAAKVQQAFEKSDTDTRDKFKKGEITQKALVESVKPKPTINDIFDDRHDVVTALAKEYGYKFQSAIRNFETLLADARTAFAVHGLQFSDFAWDTSIHKLERITAEVHFLKKYVKCPACHGSTCTHCKCGYVTEDQEKVIADIEGYKVREAVNA